jgi:hypothetical protein
LHDHSLFFDDDGKVYMVYGSGRIMLAQLKDDLSRLKPGAEPQVLIENASLPAGPNVGLPAEGSQLFKIKGNTTCSISHGRAAECKLLSFIGQITSLVPTKADWHYRIKV